MSSGELIPSFVSHHLALWAAGAVLFLWILVRVALPWAIRRQIIKMCTVGKKQIPIASDGSHPIMGHASQMMSPRHNRHLERLRDKYGSIFAFQLAFTDVSMMISDPLIVSMLVPFGSQELPKFPDAYEPFNLVFSSNSTNTLFTEGDTPKWKNVRKAMAACFSHSAMKQRFHYIRDRAETLASVLIKRAAESPNGAASIETFGEFSRLTLDVFCAAGFGREIKLLEGGPDHEWAKLQRDLDQMMMQVYKYSIPLYRHLHFLPDNIKFHRQRAGFVKAIMGLVDEVMARPEPEPSDVSVGAQLRRLKNHESSKPFTRDEMAGELATMLVAGYDTTAAALSWTFYALAAYPHTQDKLEQELVSFGFLTANGLPTGQQPGYEDLPKLKYLNAVFNESLRRYNIASDGILKINNKDNIELPNGMVLPKGCPVWIPFNLLHRNPEVWPSADEFDPERFYTDPDAEYLNKKTDGEGETTFRPKKFMPFSDGPRSCVGMTLALAEAKATIISLLSRFRIELDPIMGGIEGTEARMRMSLVLKCEGGLHLRLVPRK